MSNTITVTNNGKAISVAAKGIQGPEGVSAQSLQQVTDVGNETTNDIIQIGGRMVSPAFETSGASLLLSQRLTLFAFGNLLSIKDNVQLANDVLLQVPYDDAGTGKPIIPVISAAITAPIESVFSDTYTGTLLTLPIFTGVSDSITSRATYRFGRVGVPVKLRTIGDNGTTTFDLFGTSADPYLHFVSTAGDTVLDLASPISTNIGVTYTTTFETEDGSPLDILGDNSGPFFSNYSVVKFQSESTTPYEATIEILKAQITDFNDAEYEKVINKGVASGYAPLNSGANVPAVHINQSSVTQHEAALEILQAQITDLGFPVDSVNGKIGTVVLNTDDVLEGVNQYYPDSDALKLAGIAAGAEVNTLNAGDNVSQLVNDVPYLTSVAPAPVDSVNGKVGVVLLDSGDIPEGSNLYYPLVDKNKLVTIATGAQVNTIDSGDNVSQLVNDAGYITSAALPSDTDDLPEGATNLYYTEPRVAANGAVTLNTAKNSYPTADALKLAGVEALAEVNTINSGDNVSLLVNNVPYLTTVSGGDHEQLINIGVNDHVQIDTHIANTSNPHSVTAAQVGLGNADNTSDLNKPVSTAQQTEIDTKEDSFTKNTAFNKDFGVIGGTVCQGDDSRLSDDRTPLGHALSHVDGSDDIQDATASQKGLATAAQITKLDGIEPLAQVNAPKCYAELLQTLEGIQKPKNTGEILEWDTNGISANATPDQANDKITVGIAGDFNVLYQVSVKMKKDVDYFVELYKNGVFFRDLGDIRYKDDQTISYSDGAAVTLAAFDELQIFIITDNAMTKDYKIMAGSRFYVEKIS